MDRLHLFYDGNYYGFVFPEYLEEWLKDNPGAEFMDLFSVDPTGELFHVATFNDDEDLWIKFSPISPEFQKVLSDHEKKIQEKHDEENQLFPTSGEMP